MKTFYFLYLIVQLFCINFAHSENQTNWTKLIDLFFVQLGENCVKKENLDICESANSLIDIKIDIKTTPFISPAIIPSIESINLFLFLSKFIIFVLFRLHHIIK